MIGDEQYKQAGEKGKPFGCMWEIKKEILQMKKLVLNCIGLC